jgi:hypothetical protein
VIPQKDFTAIVFFGAVEKVGILLMASASILMVVDVDVVIGMVILMPSIILHLALVLVNECFGA